MWTENLQHKNRTIPEAHNGYKGIPIYAGYNLHQKSFEVFTKYVPDKSARILILGAGSGAFDQRLIDNGYNNLLAVEYHKDLYIPKSEVISLDLNKDFDNLGKFDAIVAMELIEHLENHFHFLRQLKSVLNHDGTVLITTPNVESKISRIKFFLRGDLSYFTKKEVTDTGHINPLFKYIFETHLNAMGMELKQHTFAAKLWNKNQFIGLKQKLSMCLFRGLSLLMIGDTGGQLSILIVQNKK